jgi:hypothetical protein
LGGYNILLPLALGITLVGVSFFQRLRKPN